MASTPTTSQAGIDALARLLHLRDGYTGLHAERASTLAGAIGEGLGLTGAEADTLRSAARLSDIGKVGIPDRILHKPGRLDAEEWAIVRCHPGWGAEVLSGLPGMQEVAHVVRSHHERWDGNGYPDGLAAEAIPLASRIIGVSEAFCSLTADRPFRPAFSPARARQVLKSGAGTHFDPRVVDALVAALDADPALGSLPGDVPVAEPAIAPDDADAVPVIAPGGALRGLTAAIAAVRLPALAESRQRLVDLAGESLPSAGAMADLVETDPGLALALVEAATARGAAPTSAHDAVSALGAEGVAEVAAEVEVFDFFTAVSGTRLPPERFRLHAVAVMRAARRLARLIGHERPGTVALAALLHDVGKLVLAAATPTYPGQVHRGARTPEQRVHAEIRALSFDHASAGAMFLRDRGVAAAVADVVDGHHDDERGTDAALVRLADMLAHYAVGAPVDSAELLTTARRLGLSPQQLRSAMYDLHATGGSEATPPDHTDPSPLTPREREALQGLASGRTYQQIAETLGLSTSTLRSHLHNAYGKLGVADRAQAVLLATERGWLA